MGRWVGRARLLPSRKRPKPWHFLQVPARQEPRPPDRSWNSCKRRRTIPYNPWESMVTRERAVTRWLIWTCVVIAWTLALEFPVPDPGEGPAGEFLLTNKFLIGKSAHIGAYAILAVLSAWLPVPLRYRWLLMFFLML